MEPKPRLCFFFFYYFVLLCFCSVFCVVVRAGDAEALLSLKSTIDPFNSLPWKGRSVCEWEGVRECVNGRVTKIVLEHLNLAGALEERIVNRFDQLRVLSFKGNSISGEVPNLSGLVNLKSLFLGHNNFSGNFPASITGLSRLKIVDLAGNSISGEIPCSLLNLRRLYALYLQDNSFTGKIPPLNQSGLRFLNVSNNHLSGDIPATPALARFNGSSYSGNIALRGVSGGDPIMPVSDGDGPSLKRTRIVKIVAGATGGLVLLASCLILSWIVFRNRFFSNTDEISSKWSVGAETDGDGVSPEEQSNGRVFGGR